MLNFFITAVPTTFLMIYEPSNPACLGIYFGILGISFTLVIHYVRFLVYMNWIGFRALAQSAVVIRGSQVTLISGPGIKLFHVLRFTLTRYGR